jgi:hypothetical protein
VPTGRPAPSTTTVRASTTTTTVEPSGSARSKSRCVTLDARLAGATAALPSATFQGHRVVFANRDLTAELLTAHDAFYDQLSPLDRQILAASSAPVENPALDTKLRASGLDWTASEVRALRTSLTRADQVAAAAHVTFRLPDPIYLAKESAAIYSGSFYTRCSAVFAPAPPTAGVLIHELFHIMSRYNPEIRAELYTLVGYRPCRVRLSSLGADLRDVVITNPDTDAFGETCVTLPEDAGPPVTYVPLLLGDGPYDGTPDGWNLILDPVLVEVRADRPVVISGKTQYRPMILPDYLRAVGENGSGEPFHPEELVALNLQQALVPNAQAAPDFPNVQLLRTVREKVASLYAGVAP